MKFNKESLSYIQDKEHLYRVLHDGEIFSFTTPVMYIPFGVDQEYNKLICRLEFPEDSKMNTQYIHIRKIISKIEKYVCEKLNVQENELKSVIRKHSSFPDIIECHIKQCKNHIITKLEFEDKASNYLKTIYQIPDKSYGIAKIEWFGVFDYRNHEDCVDKTHKVGIVLNISSLYIKK